MRDMGHGPSIPKRLGNTGQAIFFAGVVLVILSIPTPALAHSLGGLSNLPLPLTYFVAGVATLLIAGFAVLRLRWPDPRWQRVSPITRWEVPGWGWIMNLLRAVGLGGLILVVASGLVGTPSSVRNPSPVLVWVAFWLIVPFAGAFLGDVYRILNPWQSLTGLLHIGIAEPRSHSVSLGVWPATFVFLGFVWLELVYPQPAHPRHLAIAAVAYSVLLLATAEMLGRRSAFDHVDAFTTYNRLLSAMAPVDLDPSEGPGWRGLTGLGETPGFPAFVVAMIGSVAFHGVSTASWFEPAFGRIGTSMIGRTSLLILTVGVFGATYWLVCRYIANQVRTLSTERIAQRFIHVLIPVAFSYIFAHFFTAVVFEGQLLLSTLSDPFGFGWDLFGTADRTVDFTILSAVAIWWIQVIVIAVGHLAALVLAHDRSLQDFEGAGTARGRYAILLLLIVLAAAGLTILAAA